MTEFVNLKLLSLNLTAATVAFAKGYSLLIGVQLRRALSGLLLTS